MPTILPKTDVVIVGGGWTGLTAAYELCHAGKKCVVIERGAMRHESPDFRSPEMHDELTYALRYKLMMNTSRNTLTFRNRRDETALPMRRLGSFLPGENLGGAGVHWNGQLYRPLPSDLRLRSHYAEKYGPAGVPDELTIQDWGVSYDELEPHFDFFEKVCGAAGKAGNLRGEKQPGGNPFEGARQNPYPNPPMKQPLATTLFGEAALREGLNPFPQPSANVTERYVNPYGAVLHPCTYCGFCERFGCGYYAKADPIICVYDRLKGHENFGLKVNSTVMKVNKAPDGKTATGVTFVGEDGKEYEQPADMVLLCAFGLWNVHLMLLSGIGQPYDPEKNEGVVGRNYAYQTMSTTRVFFNGKHRFNPFMAAGALGTVADDFNGDNFDHSGLGFVGGGYIGVTQTNGRPVETSPIPSGTKTWGADFKKAVRDNYNSTTTIVLHGSSMATRGNYLDLDPTYSDDLGRPLLRMTFDFPENDRKMSRHVTAQAARVGRAMGGDLVESSQRASSSYSVIPYQTTHNTGGAIMGTDRRTSAVNRFGQAWDQHNVFVFGACLFPQNIGYNPTGTLMGLAYWTLAHIKSDYLANPRPLVEG
jgi:gluconate 2-dehydrogenase alpha chain